MVYFVRHQAGGVLLDYPFANPPTDEQIAPLVAEMVRLHGERSPKGEPWRTTIVSRRVLGLFDVPAIAPPPTAELRIEVNGIGTVS